MESDEIIINFIRFKSEIEEMLLESDINYIMEEFDELFSSKNKRFINDSNSSERVTNFLHCFNGLENPLKYVSFKNYAEKHNGWIYSLLSFDIDNKEEILKFKGTWTVLANLLELIRKCKKSFELSPEFFSHLYNNDVISQANKEILVIELSNKGNEAGLFKLFNVLSTKGPDWYGHILYYFAKNDFNIINMLYDDPQNIKRDTEDEMKKICLDYAKKFINVHVDQYLNENDIETSDKKVHEKDSDENISDYGSMIDEDEFCLSLDILDSQDEPNDSSNIVEQQSAELKLRTYQDELIKPAIYGKNAIIYAPTGSGKTNVAVYIANHHLSNNPNGKVAFLVHRIPLVTQQYRVFQKYKLPEFKVISMRGKSDNTSGPLVAHMPMNDIIVMTSDIFRNALTIDDGNKISSICEFSLIFFDECHNCMKSHPYTKIMEQYSKEKHEFPRRKLPQIVGLTASPRSNKKDDLPGMKNSLFQLCGNMDCCHISMVSKNKQDLKSYLARPKQTVKLTTNRTSDEFEVALKREMKFCENKLEKMRSEGYFSTIIRSIPYDKCSEQYIGFVGNLKYLNTVTIDECDGKQKAYSIYRYLNAYYRGLIVNQMFDHRYAKESIEKYLNHHGIDFSCSYDEDFYNHYQKNILTDNYEQSANPAIDEIVAQINHQMENNKESRIIVFVREIAFTIYLVDILNKMDISAEAIVGANAKSDLTCTFSEIDNILNRFKSGKTQVLVATTVVEEGLDVANCNMVISYGHVTDETAMVQRQGRARAIDSKYVLILSPMISWLAKKEQINQYRREMMNKLINQFPAINEELKEYIQTNYGPPPAKRQKIANTSSNIWKFTCRSCQTYICTSADLRIIEHSHRICIIPGLLKTFQIVNEEKVSYGSQGLYEFTGKILCNKCKNHDLGIYIHYRKDPYFQLNVKQCSATSISGQTINFKKWAEFSKYYEILHLSPQDRENYCKGLKELD